MRIRIRIFRQAGRPAGTHLELDAAADFELQLPDQPGSGPRRGEGATASAAQPTQPKEVIVPDEPRRHVYGSSERPGRSCSNPRHLEDGPLMHWHGTGSLQDILKEWKTRK